MTQDCPNSTGFSCIKIGEKEDAKSMERAPNVRQFIVGMWWSYELVRRASGCSLETKRLLGGLREQVEILDVSTRVWICTS